MYHLSLVSRKKSSVEILLTVFVAGDDQSAPEAIKTTRFASFGEEIPVAQKGVIGSLRPGKAETLRIEIVYKNRCEWRWRWQRIRISERSHPHPVVGNRDDVSEAAFQVTIEVKIDRRQVYIEAEA